MPPRFNLKSNKPKKDLKHPEQKNDERFIGNDNDYSYKKLGYKTKRKGQQAYELLPFLKEGKLIKIKGLFPTFIQNSEYYKLQSSRFELAEERKKTHGK